MVYNMIEISRIHQQRLLRAADQRRLADLAQTGQQSEKSSSTNPRSLVSEMGRGLAALVSSYNRREVFR